MTKQYKFKLKEDKQDSGMEPQLISYPGEPLDKFKDRIKKKHPKTNFDYYDLDNSDVEISEQGLIILGKMMRLFEQLRPEVKVKDVKYIMDDGKGILKKPEEKPAGAISEVSEEGTKPVSD